MSQNWIFINSPGYRSFVEATKQRPALLWGATAAATLVAAAAATFTMSTTNPGSEEKSRQTDEAEYKKLPMHTQVCWWLNISNMHAVSQASWHTMGMDCTICACRRS